MKLACCSTSALVRAVLVALHALLYAQPILAVDITGLLVGNVLVRNANSLFVQNRQLNKDACRKLCQKLEGCNAWSFCQATGGCGAGCAAHAKKNPKLAKDASRVGQPYFKLPVPLQRPGYWTHPTPGGNGCKGDRWSFGTCTLFKLTTSKPAVAAAKLSTGWISNTSPTRNPLCPRATPFNCDSCQYAQNPPLCRTCVGRVPIPPARPLQAMLDPPSTLQGACFACNTLNKATPQSAQCYQVIMTGRPCAACPLRPTGQAAVPDVGPCIDCCYRDTPAPAAFKAAPTLSSVCRIASLLPTRDLRRARQLCLQTVGVCRGSDMRLAPKKCMMPAAAKAACDTCAGDPRCAACIAKLQGSACLQCLPLTSRPARQQCFDCLTGSNRPCAACPKAMTGTKPPNLAQCLACSFTDTAPAPEYAGIPTLTDVCLAYSRLPAAKLAQAMTCLKSFNNSICLGGRFWDEKCIYPNEAREKCDTCMTSPSCKACISTSRPTTGGSPCFSCLDPSLPAAPCLACFAARRSGCLECIETITTKNIDPKTGAYVLANVMNSQCLGCFADKAVVNTDYCQSCNSVEQIKLRLFDPVKCNACIRDKTANLATCDTLL